MWAPHRLAAVVILGATLVNGQNSTTGNTTICKNSDLNFNNSNVDAVLSCIKNNPHPPYPYKLFIDRWYQGALAIPGIVNAFQIAFYGPYSWTRDSVLGGRTPTPTDLLNLTSLDLPDLENIVASFFIEWAGKLSDLNVPKLTTISEALVLNLVGGPAINLSFPSLKYVEWGVFSNGTIDSIELPALNHTLTVEVFSTGELDCNAFAASVVNATPAYNVAFDLGSNTSVICNSKKGNVTAFKPDSVSSSRSSKTVANLLLWSAVVGCISSVA
ncbi:hypothetical protein BP5796_12655 [Coleophoma crateriformis]|uniref:Uncharacterized protein n=1 Tax=Coleophoma crateriformis TaxID=565419 RepID=A0A3D8Q5S9_9HELO|nr:hypothetical protein BP5796_12655 [Coleophoma crateriformis]